MQRRRLSIQWTVMLALFAASLLATSTPASAQHESVLFSFPGSQITANGPVSGLIFDGSGNLYGTTLGGGNGTGTVFELTPSAGGGWTEKTLYSFGVTGSGDGNYPEGSLIFDAAGKLYGTTYEGGAGCNPAGCGTVFELTPAANGTWSEAILHNFQQDGTDGNFPRSELVFDAQGNLYGTTFFGGTHNLGTVYELKATAGSGWKERVLHSFANTGDGQNPQAGLIMDASGNLFGTATGVVFELTPTPGGGWRNKVLHSFATVRDGGFIMNGLIFDRVGNLYGTTSTGGSQGFGMVFELSPQANGVWTARSLHNFTLGGTDGLGPGAGVIMDSSGNLYGTTEGGGSHNCGTVFQLSTAQGLWTEKILHDFHGTDGNLPAAPLIFDASGHLYGTTFLGGANVSGGEVFEIIP
jgi:uncharacterized repeat protein (TIGR03803 family)